jgi:group I intron endonuclease
METNTGYIYCITNIVNNKKYIGATSRTVEKRFKQHLSDAKNNRNNGCTCIKNAMQEYGHEYFKLETLLICNIKDIDFYENNFIRLYDTITPNGYNLKTGGNLGSKHSKETKIKIGNAHKEKKSNRRNQNSYR